MGFFQTIAIRTSNIGPVRDLLVDWHTSQAGVAPGYIGNRILADRDNDGRYLIVIKFDSAELAAKNNERSETATWSQTLATLIDGDAEFAQYNEQHASS